MINMTQKLMDPWTLLSRGRTLMSYGGVRTFSPIPVVLRDRSACERSGLGVIEFIVVSPPFIVFSCLEPMVLWKKNTKNDVVFLDFQTSPRRLRS